MPQTGDRGIFCLLIVGVAGCLFARPPAPPAPLQIEYRWTDPEGNQRRQKFPEGPVVLLARVNSRVEVYPPGEGWHAPVAAGASDHNVTLEGVTLTVATFVPSRVNTPRELGPAFAYPDPGEEVAPESIREQAAAYAVPGSFFLVEPRLLEYSLSPRFKLGDFAGRGGQGPPIAFWSCLNYRIVDKLEAFANALTSGGFPASAIAVVSGYRSPLANREGGASVWSRHLYGDAVDLIVDRDRDGRMDDLDGDGKLGPGDLKLLGALVGRIERLGKAVPGGCGLSLTEKGAQLHIDARGHKARWADTDELKRWWDETGW